jgi:hypothetical protein
VGSGAVVGDWTLTIRWLHISDVHECKKEGYHRTAMYEAIVAEVEAIRDKPDFVFFTGDLAFSGRAEEYELLKSRLLEPLREALPAGCLLFAVPGNPKPDISCVEARTCFMRPPTFTGGESYVVYNLFARNDARISYQLYVGTNLASLQGRYVRVTPHLYAGSDSFQSGVNAPCDPMNPTPPNDWCKDLPLPEVDANGVLTLRLDQSGIKEDFKISERPDYERCVPRDFCYFDGTQCQPCTKSNAKCIAQAQRLQVDLDSLSHTDGSGKNPLEVICGDWGSFASGTKSDTSGELSLVDCPAGGCLGFAFTLPQGFSPKPYNEVGAPLSRCFAEAAWIDDELVARTNGMQLADPLCGEPRMWTASDFCTDPAPPMVGDEAVEWIVE